MSRSVVNVAIALVITVQSQLVSATAEVTWPTSGRAAFVSEQLDGASCPLSVWQGKCRRMTKKERERVHLMVASYSHDEASECVRARAAVMTWMRGFGEAWLFEQHALDDRVVGSYVFGETSRFEPTRAPAGIGFRAQLLRADPVVIARVALHEGAHLAGEDEEGARRVKDACLLPRN